MKFLKENKNFKIFFRILFKGLNKINSILSISFVYSNDYIIKTKPVEIFMKNRSFSKSIISKTL